MIGIGAGVALLALLAMVVLMLLLLGEIHTSRERIEAQDAKAGLLLQQISPLAEETRPFFDRTRRLARDAGPVLRGSRALLEPVEESATGLSETLRVVPEIQTATSLLAGRAVPLIDQLSASDLPGVIAAVSRLARVVGEDRRVVESVVSAGRLAERLDARGRLVRLVNSSLGTVERVRRRDLLAKADKSARRIKEVLDVQRTTLSVQRRSLRVQRESLRHVRSLDRKTGGDLGARAP